MNKIIFYHLQTKFVKVMFLWVSVHGGISVCLEGVSILGGLCPGGKGVSVQWGGGLCPWGGGSLSKERG